MRFEYTVIWTEDRFKRVRVGVANFFLCQPLGIDETNTFQLKLHLGSKP